MKTKSLDQFEIDWERSLKEPALREVKVKKEIDISFGTMLQRFLVFAEKSLAQGKITKADFDELVTHGGKLIKVLIRIREKDLVAAEMAERAKRRERNF